MSLLKFWFKWIFFCCDICKICFFISYNLQWLFKTHTHKTFVECFFFFGLKIHSCTYMKWTSVKCVLVHLFLIRFIPVVDLCWRCTKADPAQTHVDWPPKVNWPVNEEGLDSLHSDRVQCIAELLTCSDSWLALMGCSLACVIVFGFCLWGSECTWLD